MGKSRTADMESARRHLARRDPVLKRLIGVIGPCTLKTTRDRFGALIRSIVAQQISTKAARAISARLAEAVGPEGICPESILRLRDHELRQAGLSAGKTRSVRDLARHVQDGLIPLHRLHRMDDEEVIDSLLPVHGIGRWTAEMFLIFSLGRLDVLPVGDFGLRAGVKREYELDELPDRAVLDTLAHPWQPYRSIATWYFWRSAGFVPQSGLDPNAVKK